MQEPDPVCPAAGRVRLRGVRRVYRQGRAPVAAVDGVDLDIAPGRFTVLAGPSGSGKSTLLQLIGGLDRPDEGAVSLDGTRLDTLDDDTLTRLRGERIGFVFQSFNLVPVMSALENVELPLLQAGPSSTGSRERARSMLEAVGLQGLHRRRPGELSGGQQQRVAVARALVHRPRLVLADEPTANLDRASGQALIALMRTLQRGTGVTFVFSSHDPSLLDEADVRVQLLDGRLA
ncbi:ABC transporter ATP-binding protein [Rubrivivax gelatinosus]|uniref:ABC transporter n=1 Tax=Rubrivivax gelatinosus TaxID=28068 RepID=A0ABS1DXZ6_RUBGE|nr:ABC transporter ATP-binding protein [Rubrivivax gelatinosus]MBK1714413.1 ABC transporter [Rubrivivax gelatinosus]